MARYESTDGSTTRFWEIALDGARTIVRHGVVVVGQGSRRKLSVRGGDSEEFPSVAAAKVALEEQVRAKLAEGYKLAGVSEADERKARRKAAAAAYALHAKSIGNLKDLAESMLLDDPDPASLWEGNLLARNFVEGPSGLIDVTRDERERPSKEALQACKRESRKAAAAFGEAPLVGSDSEGTFQPYFVCASEAFRAERLDEPTVRRMFGRALYPRATVTIEPLAEDAGWWRDLLLVEEQQLAPYRRLRTWFEAQTFADTAFVTVRADDEPGGCYVVQLMLGRLPDCSVVGVLGYLVQS